STFTLYIPQTYSPPRTPRKAQQSPEPVGAATTAEPTSTDGRKRAGAASARNRANGTSPRKSDGRLTRAQQAAAAAAPPEVELVNEADDDRDRIQPGDRVLLIVENDVGFAKFLLDAAREQGMKGLVTSRGAVALALAREYKPHAVTLDIYLPDI